VKFISGGASYTSPTSQTAEKSGTRVTRPSEENLSLVRIIGEPTTPNEAASAASLDDTFKKAPESKKKHGEQKELGV
jgi:hypothetical protein